MIFFYIMTEKSFFIKNLEDELDNLEKEDINNIEKEIIIPNSELLQENNKYKNELLQENNKYKDIIGYVLLFFLLNNNILINFINNLSFIKNNSNINLIIRTIIFLICLILIVKK